jgi:glycosyltransferase involved in cell wall biosynthesis
VALRAFAGAARPGERLVLGQRQFTGRGLHQLSNRLGIEDRIVWKQMVSEEDIVTLFQAATALVQPSLAEGFGLPVLEAMACGCPVIASDIPPLREVLGGAGLLSPPGDPVALSLALRKVADDAALRDELRQRGLERARSFSWDRTAKETLEVYREAARAGSV